MILKYDIIFSLEDRKKNGIFYNNDGFCCAYCVLKISEVQTFLPFYADFSNIKKNPTNCLIEFFVEREY